MLDVVNQPFHSSCREGLSKSSLAIGMMNIKTVHNLHDVYINAWAELFKEYLPGDNLSIDSYYETQKLFYSLELSSEDRCLHQQLYNILKKQQKSTRMSLLKEATI